MTNQMRTHVYVAKVRSVGLIGADIWGWCRAYQVEKAESRSIRILTRAHGRTKMDAMLWLVGLYPLWVSAACRAFGFFMSILEHGDTMEKAALQHWKLVADEQGWGWYHEMLGMFRYVNTLDAMGGESTVSSWTAYQAKLWRQKIKEACEAKAEDNLKNSLRTGKYTFMLPVMPSLKSSRPDGVSPGTSAGRSLYNFMLSSHFLEIETGRYARITREERWCRQCYRKTGLKILGSCKQRDSPTSDSFMFPKGGCRTTGPCHHPRPITSSG